MQIKVKIKVSGKWGGMDAEQRRLYLTDQTNWLARMILRNEADTKTIRNTNGNTTHVEVKI